MGSQKIATTSKIVSTMQANLRFRSSICHELFNLIAGENLHIVKLRSTSFLAWLLANCQVLMKILSSFLLLISLDKKRRRNRGAFGEKASSEATFLILPLYNSFEDALLLFLLQPLIISSSLRFSPAKLGVSIFGKNNIGKSRGNDSKSRNADRGTEVDNPSTETDADTGAVNLDIATDNSGIAADNPGTTTDDLGTAVDNSSTAADDLGIGTDADVGVDNPSTVVDNPDIETDVDVEADNPGIVVSNKTRVRATSLFTLYHAFFLLASSSELITTSLPSSSLFSSSTTCGQNHYCHF